MQPGYLDIYSKIDEEPQWYMANGVPRYCAFETGKCNIYAQHSALYLIQCQSCGMPFLIGKDFDIYSKYQWLIDRDKLDYQATGDHDLWVDIDHQIYAPIKKDENGNDISRTRDIEDLLRDFHYDDPPRHNGCGGETMSSVKRFIVKALDKTELIDKLSLSDLTDTPWDYEDAISFYNNKLIEYGYEELLTLVKEKANDQEVEDQVEA